MSNSDYATSSWQRGRCAPEPLSNFIDHVAKKVDHNDPQSDQAAAIWLSLKRLNVKLATNEESNERMSAFLAPDRHPQAHVGPNNTSTVGVSRTYILQNRNIVVVVDPSLEYRNS